MTASEVPAVLARARQGDSEAFCQLVERHSRAAFRLAFRMTGNEQDAEDVVQESLIKAYRYLGRFETRADFGTWLYRIVANCAVDMIRARQSRQKHTLDGAVRAVDHRRGRPTCQGRNGSRRAPRFSAASRRRSTD